jgi:phytoene synthase
MCGLFGVHRKGVLARAASLGHAMQITNILRDVGEDLDRGRVYLPRQLMQQNGVTLEDLRAMRSGAPISAEYCSFIEELIAVADVAYDAAFLAIPELPSDTQSPIAIASYVYRGIHDAIRRNGYDNLNQRAHTTVIHKARLAAAALRRLRRVAADRPLAPTDETIVPDTRIVQSFAR